MSTVYRLDYTSSELYDIVSVLEPEFQPSTEPLFSTFIYGKVL